MHGVLQGGALCSTYTASQGLMLMHPVIHRIAGDGTVRGIVRLAAEYAGGTSSDIRADTHADNRTMQRALEKNGFVRCGTIYLENGSPRIAYHRAAETAARHTEEK